MLGDDEPQRLTRTILKHVAGRLPVIVTTTRFGTAACAGRGRRTQAHGAAMAMVAVMPPHHGATIRVPEARLVEFFRRLSEAISIPIRILDAPVVGTALSAVLLARMARGIEQVKYFKIETVGAAPKLRGMLAVGGGRGPVGRRGGDHDACGLLRRRHRLDDRRRQSRRHPNDRDPCLAGRREEAVSACARWLPLINCESRQCGLLAAVRRLDPLVPRWGQ